MTIALTDLAGLADAERAALASEVARLASLDRVVAWARRRRPPGTIVAQVAQDEFTHDVVLRLSDTRYLVFDTT